MSSDCFFAIWLVYFPEQKVDYIIICIFVKIGTRIQKCAIITHDRLRRKHEVREFGTSTKCLVELAEWIADLVGHGLLKASFIPDKAQRELRELLTYRKSLVSDKARELNRLQKMLEGGNIKLSGTVRDINGVSSRNLLTVLLSGKKITEDVLIEMHEQKQIAGQLKASYAQLVEDLEGVLTPLQCRMIRELLKHVDERTYCKP